MSVTAQAAPPSARTIGTDILVVCGLGCLLFGLLDVARQWEQPLRPVVEIDLSLSALPQYTLFSLARGLTAYLLSLLFTLSVATWAFYDRKAGQVILPVLDVLQSIPVLGFLPGLVLALVHIFPHQNIGLELACVLMIFTGQVWNMAFSYYDSLRAVPSDYFAVSQFSRFTSWQRFKTLELPSGANGLVYNSMMSMAGGWFFLTINEAFTLGDKDFRLPGLGSYMSEAIQQGNVRAEIGAVVAMIFMIVLLDQLLWRPLTVMVQRFKLEDVDSGNGEKSWALDLLRRSRFLNRLGTRWQAWRARPRTPRGAGSTAKPDGMRKVGQWLYRLIVFASLGVVLYWGWQLILLLTQLHGNDWQRIARDTGWTSLRVAAAVTLGTLWTIPAGVWIGLNPRWARLLQPMTQIAASFPAPMIFPVIVALLFKVGGNFEWGSVLLIMLGTQWYILFNVISGARAISQDLIAATNLLHLHGWVRWRKLYFPGIFPALLTGWITATGGAWNASIVAEYMNFQGKHLEATGLGALISEATDQGNFAMLAAAILVMATVVVTFNRLTWKPLQRLADARYRMTV